MFGREDVEPPGDEPEPLADGVDGLSKLPVRIESSPSRRCLVMTAWASSRATD